MITEFTCGTYTASWCNPNWIVDVNQYTLAFISNEGEAIKFDQLDIYLTTDCLVQIAVLMNNIKRQYKNINNG